MSRASSFRFGFPRSSFRGCLLCVFCLSGISGLFGILCCYSRLRSYDIPCCSRLRRPPHSPLPQMLSRARGPLRTKRSRMPGPPSQEPLAADHIAKFKLPFVQRHWSQCWSHLSGFGAFSPFYSLRRPTLFWKTFPVITGPCSPFPRAGRAPDKRSIFLFFFSP